MKDLKNDVVRNSELAATLVHRSSDFTARHPPRLVASASILLAVRECQSRLEEEESRDKTYKPFENRNLRFDVLHLCASLRQLFLSYFIFAREVAIPLKVDSQMLG
jgi:hypothetical protein